MPAGAGWRRCRRRSRSKAPPRCRASLDWYAREVQSRGALPRRRRGRRAATVRLSSSVAGMAPDEALRVVAASAGLELRRDGAACSRFALSRLAGPGRVAGQPPTRSPRLGGCRSAAVQSPVRSSTHRVAVIVMTAGLSLGCAGTAAVAITLPSGHRGPRRRRSPRRMRRRPASLTVGARSAALEHLRAAGLQLVWRSALVAPDLRVKSDPEQWHRGRAGRPAARATRHLTTRSRRPGRLCGGARDGAGCPVRRLRPLRRQSAGRQRSRRSSKYRSMPAATASGPAQGLALVDPDALPRIEALPRRSTRTCCA